MQLINTLSTIQPSKSEKIAQARRISTAISDVLAAKGFELYIPTTTLGEALLARDTSGGKASHIFDCDTGSFIFLTVAEYLKAPVSMVEIKLPSGDGHNYVRWRIDDQTSFDWDLNGRSECTTPPNLPSYQGKSMSRSATLGYALTLRAQIWARRKQYPAALSDFRTAMSSYPESPTAYNNFAWLIATTVMPGEEQLSQEALVAANRAISIDRSANYLDTVACVYALRNDFEHAANYEREASAKDPGNADFKTRLTSFTSSKPSNCIGAK
jgi:tetratricopeptide (TPR) repeat protein